MRREGRKHYDLVLWQQAMLLVKHVYEATRVFPAEEKFGLISQMRRAAVSVPSNIAEGAARQANKEFVQFRVIARGSLSELDTHSCWRRIWRLRQDSPSLKARSTAFSDCWVGS